MKTVCAANNLLCSIQQTQEALTVDHLSYLGIACGVFVVVSVIRFVFLD